MEKTLVLLITVLFATTTSATFTEFGKLLGVFPDDSLHRIAGTIYVVDETTINVRGFSYDGTAPDAFFYGGDTDTPSENGVIIPDEDGTTIKLGQYSDQNLLLSLPPGKTINSFKWISIWCRQVGANFGHVDVPADFAAPAPLELGVLGFTPRVHGVRADEVIILNTRQIRFMNLDYDGQGPAAFFWVDTGTTPTRNGKMVRHPDDTAGDKLPSYDGADITVTLPAGSQISDYGNIGLWCEAARQDFGHVVIPGTLNVPPYLGTPELPALSNCLALVEDRFHISWGIDQEMGKITLKFIGAVEREEYMAFGISGSDSSTSMVGSDVTVAYVDDIGMVHADDYYLNAYAQCSPTSGDGACPDDLQDGTNDVTPMGAIVRNGITVITAERPLSTSDAKDKDIPLGLAYISWGIGKINPTGHVSKHDTRTTGNLQIDFSQASSTCEAFAPPLAKDGLEPWVIDSITPDPSPEVITAHIGPSGGAQGYQGIAGKVGWGIAWYLNGQLVPVLHVRRNCTYRFEIYGGNDSTNTANFHPFYITSDENGGYNQKTPAQREGEIIYAGPTGGALCEYTSDKISDNYDTFEDFQNTLDLDCPASSEPGILDWTVTEDTKDVVYYQCYQHRFFGWKIMVTDSAPSVGHHLSVMLILVTVAAMFNLI